MNSIIIFCCHLIIMSFVSQKSHLGPGFTFRVNVRLNLILNTTPRMPAA